MRLWYLRRAVPWAALLGCLVAAVVVTALVHRWESFASLGLPLALLVTGAAAAFLLDEPSVAVTSVTPRGGRWSRLARVLVAPLPAVVALVLLATAPDAVRPDGSDSALVIGGLVSVVVLLALMGSRRQVARPGSAMAPGVVLLGLTPLVLGMFFDLRSPYPLPVLDANVRDLWLGASLVGVLGAGVLVRSDQP